MYPYNIIDESDDDRNYTGQKDDLFGRPNRPYFLDDLDDMLDKHNNSPKDQRDRAPSGPPPAVRPYKEPSIRAVDPGSIRGCMYSYNYVYLNSGSSFWIYPTHVGRKSLSGYRYTRRRGWVYFGIDLDEIQSFYCTPTRG